MAIQVMWANPEQTCVRVTLQRGWTWNELHRAIQQADDLIVSVTHTVDLLIDIREAGGLPGDFMTRAGDIFAQGEARPNEGQKIVIGAGWLIRSAYTGFVKTFGSQLQGRPFRFAASLEEAQALLRR